MAVVALLAVTLAGLVLRVWPVATRALWHDEVMTWRFTTQASWWDILTWRQHYEHPPLSFFFVKASIALFGSEAEWVLRLPSLVCGVLTIPAGYLLGRLLHGRWLGVLIAALVAFDFNQIIQSQQARMYTLTVLTAVLTLCGLIWALSVEQASERSEAGGATARAPSSRFALCASLLPWLAVGAGLAACFAASNMGMILWAALPLGLLVAAALGRASAPARWGVVLRGLMIAYAAALAGCSVGIVVMLGRLAWFRDKSGSVPIGERVAGLLNDLGHAYASLPVALMVLTIGVAGVLLLSRLRRTTACVLLAIVVVNLLFVLPVQPHGFEPRPRYVILLQVPLWIGLAYLAVSARPVLLRGGLLVGLAGLSAWTAAESLGHGEQWRYRFGEAIELVAPRVAPGDAVVFFPAWVDDLPAYYGLPPTHNPPPWAGQTWRHDRLLPFDALPADRPTWLVIAYHHETGGADAAPDFIQAAAERYGVTIDHATARDVLVRQPVVVARVDASGVRYVDLTDALDP